MDTTLSIIIAIYNRKDELTELLESLCRQTDSDFEVLVIDDGSTEELESLVDSFASRLEIRYFKKPNSGPGLSRNFGAGKAQNAWLIFLDSDVEVPSHYIQNIKAQLRRNPTDAFGGADTADVHFSPLQKAISYTMTSVLTTGGIRGSHNAVGKFQPRSFNMGVKKSVFESVGGFSEMRIGEDPDLTMTLWERGFQTRFYSGISVFHKRRATLRKFGRQVYQFGCARPILNHRHPQYTKITFGFPSLFSLGFLGAFLLGIVAGCWLFLWSYAVYFLMIGIHATALHKSAVVGAWSVVATAVQMSCYGTGFLESWLKINILGKSPREAFPHHFH